GALLCGTGRALATVIAPRGAPALRPTGDRGSSKTTGRRGRRMNPAAATSLPVFWTHGRTPNDQLAGSFSSNGFPRVLPRAAGIRPGGRRQLLVRIDQEPVFVGGIPRPAQLGRQHLGQAPGCRERSAPGRPSRGRRLGLEVAKVLPRNVLTANQQEVE